MSVVYMGAFPPGYGGVTIKNQNLYLALEKEINIKKVDFNKIKRKKIKEIIRFIYHLINPMDKFVIGVSGKKTRKRFTQVLYYLNRAAMKKSIIFVMGGTASHDMSTDLEYKKCAKEYKKIYVETLGMKEEMDKAGFKNVEIYPNGRFRDKYVRERRSSNKVLSCVFFSLIQPEKGADIVIQAAENLSNVEFSFYGKIDSNFEKYFTSSINNLSNIKYKGVFKGTSEEVYSELSKYDVLLFPTKWDCEGIPGVLVEGKIAGLAEIVSNKSYNSEIVKDGIEGIVLSTNSYEELSRVIQKLVNDREWLHFLKQGSKKSAERYYIENYIKDISRELEE